MILYLTQGGKYTGETLEQDDKLPIPHNAALTPPPDDTHVFFNGYWIPETDVPKAEQPQLIKTPEQLRAELKAERDAKVSAIVVTTSTGKAFNGDETSQTRMSRAIVAMQIAGANTITWVLADNTAVEVTLTELSEALVLAGQAQAAIWVLSN